MSLTAEDLLQIRTVVQEVVRPLESEIKALRNDIKEIYDKIAKLEQNVVFKDGALQKLSVKKQILQLNASILALAKNEGVTLPR